MTTTADKLYKSEIIPALARLRPVALQLTRSPEDADDLMGDTALKAWKFRASFDPEIGTAQAWLFVMLRRVWFNELAKRERRSAGEQRYYVDPTQIAKGGRRAATWSSVCIGPEQAIDDAREINGLRAEVAKLRTPYREAVTARIEADRYDPVLADALGIKFGTLCSRMNRAQAQLRESLAA